MTSIPSTSTRVLSHGGGVFTVTSVHAAPQALSPGTYGVQFSPMSGYSLVELDDLQPPRHRVYGSRDQTVAKVLRTYGHLDRSLGVLFEGDKGIGKSSTTVELARQARDLFDVPVILVNKDTPDLAEFLSSLGECVIVLDEFEKNFPIRHHEKGNRQDQFLTLFDGTDQVKRMYIVTINDKNLLSEFFLNRPGRFHYLISFAYPDAEAVTEYLTNEVPSASEQQIADAVSFAVRARLNYDHLRAVATELTIAGPEEKVSDLVADLNLRDTESRYYDLTFFCANGKVFKTPSVNMELFAPDDELVTFTPTGVPHVNGRPPIVEVSFPPSNVVMDGSTKKLTLSEESITSQKLRGLGDEMEEWERTLLETTGSIPDGEGEFDLVSAEGALAGLRVVHIELTPAPSSSDERFF